MSYIDDLDRLICGLQALRSKAASKSEVKKGIQRHLLGCISILGSVSLDEPAQPVHDEVFQASIIEIMSRNSKLANREALVESFPTKWIHQQYPGDNCAETALDSWLPLHWCASLSNDSETINTSHLKGLLSEDSSLELISTDPEVSPTSLAIAKLNPSTTFVNELISINPEVIKRSDRDGALALMYAGAWNNDTFLLERLYTLYPRAISESDAYGFLPLHFTCYAGTTESVTFLLSKYSKAAKIKNRAGVLPLLASAANVRRGGVEMARVLLDEYPEAISVQDNEGSLPLHIAAQFASFDLIRFLYAVNPSAASTANSEGLLPMHFAGLRKEKNIDIVDFLSEANTDAEAAKFVPTAAPKEECIVS